MSEYTTCQILDMIEANGGSEGLDLSGKDLSGIDLSRETIQAEWAKAREEDPAAWPLRVSEWTKGISLKEANLQGAALVGAKLQGAHLERANLQKADLTEANLHEAILAVARLQGANLRGALLQEANLMGAKLQKAVLTRAILQKADLWGANLRGARLERACLRGAQLREADLREAYLSEANLEGANLREADLRQVDLGGAASLRGAFLYRARLDHTEMNRNLLGPAIGEESAENLRHRYSWARDTYLRLKQNFDDLGDYTASAWAYQKERQMEKACNSPWRARGIYGKAELGHTLWYRAPLWHPRIWWFYSRHTFKWLFDWFVEYLCGYGESIGRVLFWMVAALFGFAAYYWSIGGVWLVEPNGEARVATSFQHYLIYSAGAFTTTQFAKLQAADDRVRMVTAIQAIIGIVLAGLLGFVAGNRIRRS